MIRQVAIPLARRQGYRFTRWLMAAYLLAGSSIATIVNGTPTILATNQGSVTNIIVDGSRVYWINVNDSTVSSVDKLNGGKVLIHSAAATLYGSTIPALGGDLQQDATDIYFVSATGGDYIAVNSTYNIYSVGKTASDDAFLVTAVQPPSETNPDPAETNPGSPALGLATGDYEDTGEPEEVLLYFSGAQNIPPDIYSGNDLCVGEIELITKFGGTPTQIIPFTTDLNTTPDVLPNHFSFPYWSNIAPTNSGILTFSGNNWELVAGATYPGAISAPTTGPADGYIFWEDTTSTTTNLMAKKPGQAPVVLMAGVNDTGQSSFVQEGSFIYCIKELDGTIVSIPLAGGSPTVVVGTLDAFAPSGLTSDGNYLYWAAAGDGSIRRVPLPNKNYTISVSASPTTGGTVTGDGIYTSGSAVTVTATADAGYTFTNWTEGGVIVSTSRSYTFTVTGNRTLVANFTATSTTYTVTVSASPSAGGTVGGGGTYAAGSSRTVTSTANSGYSFSNWTESGSVVSTSASYTFTLGANRTLVANFTATTTYTITTSSSPSNGGTTSGGGTFAAGTSHTVTAAANSGYAFSNWTENGSVVSASTSYTFTLTTNRTLVANFTANTTYTIAVSASPGAGGTVSGGGTFAAGSSRTVTASANSGYSFSNWTENGSVVSTSATYTFTLNANRTLVANFTITYTITTSSSPSNGGTTSGGGTFAAGTSHTVTASPNSGYTFSNWTENGNVVSTSASYTFTLSANRILVANFTAATTYTITTSSSPTNGGTTSGGGTFAAGTSQTVTASANTGFTFSNWTENGNVVSTSASYTFTLNTNRTLVANFTVSGSQVNLTPYQPTGWSDKIVVSNVTGTNTDGVPLTSADTLYVDWAVDNNGTAPTTVTFYTQLYVDNILRNTWSSAPPLNPNFHTYILDYSIGSLGVGTHTVKIVTDSTNAIAESNESDNQYTKTIVIAVLPTAATPTISPASGAYQKSVSVTISDATPGAVLHYTTDGTTPTASSPIYNLAGKVGKKKSKGTVIKLTANSRVEAIAIENGFADSAVAEADYTITAKKKKK